MEFIKSHWQMAIGLILFLATVSWIQWHYGWLNLLSPWQSVSITGLLGALTLVLTSYILRALRFYDYFHQYTHKHFTLILRITTLHNFFNNFLPMRSGEVAFPVQMKSHFSIPYNLSGPSLFFLRLLDLQVLTLIGFTLLSSALSPLLMLPVFVAGACLPGLVFYLILKLYRSPSRQKQQASLSKKPVTNKLSSLVNMLNNGSPNTMSQLYRAWFWTLINWMIKIFAFTYILLQFLSTNIETAVLGVASGELSSVLPIHGVAGIGSYEAAMLAGLLPQGISFDDAMSAATNLHIFILGTTIVLTACIYLFTKTIKSPTPAVSQG